MKNGVRFLLAATLGLAAAACDMTPDRQLAAVLHVNSTDHDQLCQLAERDLADFEITLAGSVTVLCLTEKTVSVGGMFGMSGDLKDVQSKLAQLTVQYDEIVGQNNRLLRAAQNARCPSSKGKLEERTYQYAKSALCK